MAVGALLPALPASAAASDPAQWPAAPGLDPELTATPHAIRFAGPDRYQTNLALNLALRGRGGFPFDTSDRTSGNADGLARAGDWWGAGSCPRSIIVVAGDTFADALSAASLSDPTDQAQQPRAQRVAAADPLFDPVGGFDRIETAFAPIVVTDSGRSGATALAQTARLTAADLATGGCTTAREAIIVGGSGAVPTGVESELLGLGYEEVFRIAGRDRYDTAGRVAAAMGTGATPEGTTCLDDVSTDGATRLGFHGNGAPEYRFDGDQCSVLPRSVVLADGGTGADALAAGWWTSRWQVPVLLTEPDGSLPPATRTALQTLDVDTIIVLGGLSRIPEATVEAAQALAGARRAGRVAGADRYETSVAMAKAFGGWHPAADGSDFAGDRLCLTSSSGSGAASRGWPDALAAGPFCARLAAAGTPSPERALPTGTGRSTLTGGQPAAHDAVPVLLVPVGAGNLPESLKSFLGSAFDASSAWCQGESAVPGCVEPGFAVTLTGEGSVPGLALDEVTDLVSGGFGSDRGDRHPRQERGFLTELNLTPVYRVPDGDLFHCGGLGAVRNVRWRSFTGDRERRIFLGEQDLAVAGYGSDGRSLPGCAAVPSRDLLAVSGVSPSGAVTSPEVHRALPGEALRLTGVVRQRGSGSADGGSWRSAGPLLDPVSLQQGPDSEAITTATLDLDLRFGAGSATPVTGRAVLETSSSTVEVSIEGEAFVSGDLTNVAGRARIIRSGKLLVVGGFLAEFQSGPDGSVAWRFDGFPAPG